MEDGLQNAVSATVLPSRKKSHSKLAASVEGKQSNKDLRVSAKDLRAADEEPIGLVDMLNSSGSRNGGFSRTSSIKTTESRREFLAPPESTESFDVDDFLKSKEALATTTQGTPKSVRSVRSYRGSLKPTDALYIDEMIASREELVLGMSRPRSRVASVGGHSFKGFFAKETQEVFDMGEITIQKDKIRRTTDRAYSFVSAQALESSDFSSEDNMPPDFDSMVNVTSKEVRRPRTGKAVPLRRGNSEDSVIDCDPKDEDTKPPNRISLALSMSEFKQTADQLKDAFSKLVGIGRVFKIARKTVSYSS
ncbi:hypothetical protein BDR26DRAFT_251543 [Obelidium mucronatum]|nr:hypothetical protein BDR26DRAFT_251543 [Obelidium mucronatum]